MTIRSIEAIPIAIRETTEREVGYGKISVRRNVIVLIHDDSGVSGVAETAPIPIRWGCEETQETIVSTIQNYMAPLLVGEDPTRCNFLMDRIHDRVGDLPYASTGVGDALLDLSARLAGVPLYRLIGGKRRDSIPAGWSVSIKPEAEMAAEAAKAVSLGYQWIKVKIGKNPRQDSRRLSAIREAIGEDVAIHIDMNGQYSYLDALEILPQMELCRPRLIEQPVAGWDIRSMKSLRMKLKTPLMADESCRSYRDLQNLIANDAADAIVLKLAKHGGIRETQKIADLAASYGMMMYPSIHYSTSIGVSASAHFYATIPNITPGSFHQGAALFEHDLIKITPEAEKGYFPIPEGIGIGLTIDPELLERARADKK
ncbi:MAG TPA: mandelate racemase/muconate lactonizing enzyme family protein [Dongiaceae bacterium]